MIDSIRPLINMARSTAGRMWLVSLCAFLVIVQSSLGDSFSSLLIAFSAVAAAVLTEFLILRKRERAIAIKDGSAVATALILTLLLPNQISPFYAAIGAVFAIAVVKHSFGGLGSNWLNPAAGGWLFIRFSWPASFSRALEASPLSLLTESVNRGVTNFEGSPLGILKTDAADLFAAASPLDGRISSFFNSAIFSFVGVELPGGYLDLFGSRFPGIIADRGVLALLFGTIIIFASQVNRSWIPVVFLAFFGFFVRYAGALPYGGGLWNGDLLFALCSGGTLVAAFFLAADPATGPKSNRGIFLAAAAAGVLAFVFRYYGAEPYGAVFAVVLVNALTPLIRIVESRRLYEKQGKAWISEIQLMFPFSLFTGKKLSGGKNE